MELVLQFFGALLGSGGVGALMIKYMLNGSREGIVRIEKKVNEELPEIRKTQVEHGERLAHIEGTCSARRDCSWGA
jgi:hypothetical protein